MNLLRFLAATLALFILVVLAPVSAGAAPLQAQTISPLRRQSAPTPGARRSPPDTCLGLPTSFGRCPFPR